MLGIPELTVELRTLQQRADVYVPPLTQALNRVAGAVEELTAEWRKTGDPDFAQLVVQLQSLNAKGDQVKELIALLRGLGADEGLVKKLIKFGVGKAKGAVDGG